MLQNSTKQLNIPSKLGIGLCTATGIQNLNEITLFQKLLSKTPDEHQNG
jgi:hypothetical protein